MSKLIEEVKKLKEEKKQLEKVTVQNVEWDLDPGFIGEPMIPRVLKALSKYVDTKLVDYSSILGSVPATNTPQGRILRNARPNEEFPLLYMDNPIDEHVCSESDVLPTMAHLTNDGQIRDNPEVLGQIEESGSPLVNPTVDIFDRHTEEDLIADNGRPGSEVLLNFSNGNGPSASTPPPDIPETSYMSELQGDNEHDTVITGGSINSMAGAFPDVHAWLREQQEVQQMCQITENGLRSMLRGTVTGIAPGTTVNAPYGHIGDFQIYSGGCTPQARQRYRDSFVRDRHVTFQMIPELSEGKEISYVTSYTIVHSTGKIIARVVTAPNGFQIRDDLWSELCDNSGHTAYDLRDMIRSTLKANLCIHMKSRASPLPKNTQESERIALETLREMISEQEFRNYLKYGFILVKGQSGRIYQISQHNQHTKVWDRGVLVEEVCVRINRQIGVPPTDNVIAFKVMIETSEELFKSRGNVYNTSKKKVA